MEERHVSYKILLKPNDEIVNEFNKYFGARNYMYNWTIDNIEEHYRYAISNDLKYRFLTDKSLQKRLTYIKSHDKDKSWLNKYNVDALRGGIKDACHAYKMFFNKISNKPRYHKRKFNQQNFVTRHDRLEILKDKVRLCGIGYVDTDGNIPDEILGFTNGNKQELENQGYSKKKYYNTRVVFDGIKYYLTVSMICDESKDITFNSCRKYKQNDVWRHRQENSTEVIGIDVGCKLDNWFTCSTGYVQKRRSQAKEDKRIKGYQKKFQRQINSLKKRKNITSVRTKHYTKSMIKTLKRMNKIYKKITNRKKNDIMEFGSYLLRQAPKAVVFEDFKVYDMIITDISKPKNVRNRINKNIYDSVLFRARERLTHKLKANNVEVILADNEYPSTQLCSNCGHQQKMEIYQRTYRCPVCGNVIDRDLNASINLQHYGEDFIKSRNLEIA